MLISKVVKNFWKKADHGLEADGTNPASVVDSRPREYRFISLSPTLEIPPLYDVGIEITLTHLWSPQAVMLDHHGVRVTASHPAAIEQAAMVALPAAGATIAVLEEHDADAIGAAAVLYNRGQQLPNKPRIINIIAKGDRYGIVSMTNKWHRRIFLAISTKVGSPQLSLEEKITWLARVLTEGKIPESEFLTLLRARDDMYARAVREARVWMTAKNRICVVESTNRFATKIGYERANIVIAVNDQYPLDERDPTRGGYLKYTICRCNEFVAVDLKGVLTTLNELEKVRLNDRRMWGGRVDIIGSPQGRSSTISLDEVVTIVTAHLYNYD